MSRTILARAALPSGRARWRRTSSRPPDHNQVTPYVTWQQNLADGSTYWGHYHHTKRRRRGVL